MGYCILEAGMAEKDEVEMLVTFGEWLIENRWTQRVSNSDGMFYFQQYTNLGNRILKTMDELVGMYFKS